MRSTRFSIARQGSVVGSDVVDLNDHPMASAGREDGTAGQSREFCCKIQIVRA